MKMNAIKLFLTTSYVIVAAVLKGCGGNKQSKGLTEGATTRHWGGGLSGCSST